MIAEMAEMNHINLSALIGPKNLHSGRNEEFDCFILDEDKACDELEPIMAKGGNILDFHSCDFFPERWFQLVVVLRTSNEVLYERLEDRKYSAIKINENVEAEIMQVVLDEARESYDEQIIVELPSNTVADMESNVERVVSWIQTYIANQSL